MSKFDNIDDAMTHLLDRITLHGHITAPRGKRVKEVIGSSITFDMRYPIVTKQSRKIGHRFYPAEAAWILSGRNDRAFFEQLNMPFIWEFSDDGFFYQGAYGPRVVDQLIYVCDSLSADYATRQAVIEVWRPNPRVSRDIPCTLSYQFLARDGKLNCVQYMRSSDAWLGYPYDAFNAAMLTTYIILLLRTREKNPVTFELGNHTLVVGSQHLYEPEWEPALKFLDDQSRIYYPPISPRMFATPGDLLARLHQLAESKHGVNPAYPRVSPLALPDAFAEST